MIACTASPGRLYAAPFAIVGSIGVIGQTINIQKTLDKFGIRSYIFKGGEYKAPIGLLGDVTKDNIKHIQSMIDTTHEAFQHHVIKHRPILTDTIHIIGNGNIWLGYYAIDYQLIDRIITSDEYMYERIYNDHTNIYNLVSMTKSKYPFLKPNVYASSSSSTSNIIKQSPLLYNHHPSHQFIGNTNQQSIPTTLSNNDENKTSMNFKKSMMRFITDQILPFLMI